MISFCKKNIKSFIVLVSVLHSSIVFCMQKPTIDVKNGESQADLKNNVYLEDNVDHVNCADRVSLDDSVAIEIVDENCPAYKKQFRKSRWLKENWGKENGYMFEDIPEEIFFGHIFKYILYGQVFAKLISVNDQMRRIGQDYIVQVDLKDYIMGYSLSDYAQYLVSKKTTAEQDFEHVNAKVIEKIAKYGACALLVKADDMRSIVMLNEQLLQTRGDGKKNIWYLGLFQLKELFDRMSEYEKFDFKNSYEIKREGNYCKFCFTDLKEFFIWLKINRMEPGIKYFISMLCCGCKKKNCSQIFKKEYLHRIHLIVEDPLDIMPPVEDILPIEPTEKNYPKVFTGGLGIYGKSMCVEWKSDWAATWDEYKGGYADEELYAAIQRRKAERRRRQELWARGV